MKWMATVLATSAAALLTGCAPVLSVNPLYTDTSSVKEPAVAGIWEDVDGSETWVVRDAGDNGYSLVVAPVKENDAVQVYDVRLVRVGGLLFADGTLRRESDIAGHLLASVSVEGDNLRVALPDAEWLKKERPDFPLPAHTSNGDPLVFTATTAEVQLFMTKCAGMPGCLGEPATFHRVK